jgi:hypothetical protein
MSIAWQFIQLDQQRKAHPKWEVFAPDGFQFADGAHSRVFWTKADAKADLVGEKVVPCPTDCDCGEAHVNE